MSEPRWAAVVVNHDSGDHLIRCVESVVADGADEIVVVDNASSDDSLATLAAAFPPGSPGGARVTVDEAGANLGYARGANRGIARTRAGVVAVLNPDIVVRPGTGRALARVLTDDGIAAVGPRIRNVDGSTYPSARTVPSTWDAAGHGLFGLVWPRNPYSRRYRQLDADWSRPREVDWVSGAAIWLRRDALEAVGGWDERFFMYVEDVELCWRLRRHGWRIAYEPAGEVVHVQGASTSRRPYRMLLEHHRSLLRFAAKRWHGPKRVLLAPAAVYLAARAVLTMIRHALGGRSGATVADE